MFLFRHALIDLKMGQISLYITDNSSSDGDNILHSLCKLKDQNCALYMIEKLLENTNFHIDSKNKKGLTPLFLAALNGKM